MFIALIVGYTSIAPNFDQAFINYAFASAAIFLVVAGSDRAAWIAAVGAAAVFSLAHAFLPQGPDVARASANLFAAMLGRGALVVLGWRAIWASPQESQRLLRMSLLPVGIILFVLASLVALNLSVRIQTPVLDSYLYVFDGSLGFQPSFVLGQLFSRYMLIGEVVRAAYFCLPLGIALICAGYINYGSPLRPLGVLATAGLFGYLLYFVFPATGPVYVYGASFPGAPQPFRTLAQMQPHPLALPISAPRNAMPSLHMAWALLIWFNCRPFSRVWRGLALSYIVLTVLATLGTGEHYLADLVVAVPFAVAVQALWAPVRSHTKYFVLAGGTTLTLLWFLALRYGSGLFLSSRVIPWASLIVSIVISLELERLLYVSQPSHPTEADASRVR